MSRLAASFVLGYHGCDEEAADAIVTGAPIAESNNPYDWLGPGIYFWEADPQRALEFAHWKRDQGDFKSPAVIGAVIDLRNCLDLVARENLALLKSAYKSYVDLKTKDGLPIAVNKRAAKSPDTDRALRYLDCAVIRHFYKMIESNTTIPPFDTARGMFTEGPPLYKGSAILAKNHVQIAVRNSACILGVFLPRTGTEGMG